MSGWWVIETFVEDREVWKPIGFGPDKASLREALRLATEVRLFNEKKAVRVRNLRSNTWMLV